MPRLVSFVIILSSLFPIVRSQTLSTLVEEGARYVRRVPSGEMRAWARVGLPRKTSRGTSGGSSERAGSGVRAAQAAAARIRSEGKRCGVLTEHLREGWGQGRLKQ